MATPLLSPFFLRLDLLRTQVAERVDAIEETERRRRRRRVHKTVQTAATSGGEAHSPPRARVASATPREGEATSFVRRMELHSSRCLAVAAQRLVGSEESAQRAQMNTLNFYFLSSLTRV